MLWAFGPGTTGWRGAEPILVVEILLSDIPSGNHTWQWTLYQLYRYTLYSFKIALENGPFIVNVPSKNGDLPGLCKRLPEGR